MARLPKFTLSHNNKNQRWDLKNDATDRVVRTFEHKQDATARGVLKGTVGASGGSVKIQKENGRYQEERTYPRSADPKSSPG